MDLCFVPARCGYFVASAFFFSLRRLSISDVVLRRVAYEESSQRKILKILGKETKTADENNKAAAENGTKQ